MTQTNFNTALEKEKNKLMRRTNLRDTVATVVSSLFKKAAVSLVAVGLAGIMSTTEANAQCPNGWPTYRSNGFEVNIWNNTPGSPDGRVHIGRTQRSVWTILDDPYVRLAFGASLDANNDGLWHVYTRRGGFNIGKAWNQPISGVQGINNYGMYALTICHNGTVGINLQEPFSNYNWINPANHNERDIRLRVAGGIWANGLYYRSDKRYKARIEPINNLQNFFRLNAVQYTPSSEAYKEQLEIFKKNQKDLLPEEDFNRTVSSYKKRIAEADEDSSLDYGFIAQELLELFPDLVIEDSQGFMAVNYTGLIPVLVDVVQEQQNQINEQQKVLEEQQKQINYLLTREKGKAIGTDALFNDAMLYQNNPNPFSAHTEIKFYIPDQSNNAFICIYDMNGREVMKLDIAGRGHSSVTVNGRQLQAGMYLYSLIVDGKEIDTKRMILTNN